MEYLALAVAVAVAVAVATTPHNHNHNPLLLGQGQGQGQDRCLCLRKAQGNFKSRRLQNNREKSCNCNGFCNELHNDLLACRE